MNMSALSNEKKRSVWVGRFFVFAGLFFLSAMPAQAQNVPQNRAQLQLSFAPVVAKATPAVVNVYAKKRVKTAHPFLFDDPFFGQFFGRGFGRQERLQNSLGSGVIVDAAGIVVTNYHVIQGGQEFTVVLSDRREFKANLLLADKGTDLAVLKLVIKEGAQEKFPILAYRDSDNVRVGDLVLAIGNPFGVGQTVTGGIVSGLARNKVGASNFQSFIQTDAAINPGNSGGALVTVDGRLLGINTAIYSRSGGSNGIGFAIPANMVRRVVRAALTDGEIIRPWLGAQLQPVTQALADTLALDNPNGALVVQAHNDSPLLKAGLRAGDVILQFDGFDITRPDDLRYRLAVAEPEQKIRLVYLRDGRKRTAMIRLIAAPETPPRNATVIQGKNIFNGVELSNVNPALAEELGLAHETGVVVTDITARNRLNLRRGDVLMRINKQKIENVQQARDIIRAHRGGWALEIKRGGQLIRKTIR